MSEQEKKTPIQDKQTLNEGIETIVQVFDEKRAVKMSNVGSKLKSKMYKEIFDAVKETNKKIFLDEQLEDLNNQKAQMQMKI